MDIFEAQCTVRACQDALLDAQKEWNKALTEFVEREFPDPVTMRYRGKDTKGMVKVVTYSGLPLAEVHLIPFTKQGTLSKNAIGFPAVNRFDVAHAKSQEDLKQKIINELCLVSVEED